MRKVVKPLVLFTFSSLTGVITSAQLKLPSVNGIGSDLRKESSEYSNGFENIAGER